MSKGILDIKKGFIMHQVNCRGVMGAGVALAIKKTYPSVYKEYMDMCSNNKDSDMLGKVQVVNVKPGLSVVNAFGQFEYGRNKQYTDYDAWRKIVESLNDDFGNNPVIYIPEKIGCGLAGGDWETMKQILSELQCEVNMVNEKGVITNLKNKNNGGKIMRKFDMAKVTKAEVLGMTTEEAVFYFVTNEKATVKAMDVSLIMDEDVTRFIIEKETEYKNNNNSTKQETKKTKKEEETKMEKKARRTNKKAETTETENVMTKHEKHEAYVKATATCIVNFLRNKDVSDDKKVGPNMLKYRLNPEPKYANLKVTMEELFGAMFPTYHKDFVNMCVKNGLEEEINNSSFKAVKGDMDKNGYVPSYKLYDNSKKQNKAVAQEETKPATHVANNAPDTKALEYTAELMAKFTQQPATVVTQKVLKKIVIKGEVELHLNDNGDILSLKTGKDAEFSWDEYVAEVKESVHTTQEAIVPVVETAQQDTAEEIKTAKEENIQEEEVVDYNDYSDVDYESLAGTTAEVMAYNADC